MGIPSPSFCSADPVLATVPARHFVELTAELADLAEAIVRTTLHVKINAVIADAAEVDRTAEALRAATRYATETAEEVELNLNSAALASDARLAEMVETANFSLLPQPKRCAGDASSGESDLIDKLDGVAFAEPANTGCREDDTFATRLLELRDRLGGFIEPAQSRQTKSSVLNS